MYFLWDIFPLEVKASLKKDFNIVIEANEKELFKKIARGQYELPSHLSEDAKVLIRKMLRINPLSRPSAEEVKFL